MATSWLTKQGIIETPTNNNMAASFDFVEFQKKLDAIHEWPSVYTFKFIVLKDHVAEVAALFPRNEVVQKPSSKGKYVSTTVRMMATSSDEVVGLYKKASTIEGIIAL